MTWRLRIQPGPLLVLVAVAVGAEAPPPLQETSVHKCVNMSSYYIKQYMCNDGEYKILAELQGYFHAVFIKCQDTQLTCSRFPSTDLGRNSTLTRLVVIGCGLDAPVACFLAKLNFADVQTLYFRNLLTSLAARHFEGLRATTALLINNTGYRSVQKSIPYQIIASLPHLEKVEINGDQLTLAPGLLQAPLLEKLDLSSDAIAHLPPGAFSGLPSLNWLFLQNNAIVDISNDTFAGLEKLRELNLNRNRISELRGGALSPLRRLERLYIKDNPLTRLHGGFLQGLDQLQKIEISSSEPLVLGPRAFADLKSLLYLILQDSRIKELNATVFQGSRLIHIVSLRYNQLERIHPQVFWDQTEMTTLDLSKNRLATITGSLFKGLAKLENLDLSFNQLEYFPIDMFLFLFNLKSLSASYNKLKEISSHTLHSITLIEFVDLSYNLISDIRNATKAGRFNLRLLNLTHNRIWKLPFVKLDLTGVVTVPTVDLSYNNISSIVMNPVTLLDQKTPVKFILDYNPLICDCHIYSFAKLMTFYHYAQYFSFWNARCNEPVQLNGTRLTHVPLDRFECQIKCPSVCNCTYVPNKDITEAVCSGVSTEPSNITNHVSLKFTRKPESLQNLSFENVVKIDFSGLHLNEIESITLPKTVKVLNLSNNNLNYLPKDVLKRNISFVLSNNPLFCDCWNQEHVAELQQNSTNIIDYPALRCKYDMLLSQVDVQRICDIWKVTIIGVSLTGLGVVCLLFAVIIYRYSFEVKVYISKYFPYLLPEEKYDASKKFDVFISYAHQDEEFVADTLLPKLEGPPINVKTCIHSRDWIAGEMIPYNIAKSVEESRRTVIVLSENFLKSIWGLLEFRAAHVQAIKERKTRVVVILLEDVMNKEDLNKEIKAYLRTNTYIKWGEPWFWEKLAYALPKRGKVVDSREEKRLQAIANELAKTGLEMQQNNED